jgi:hypothetical protein
VEAAIATLVGVVAMLSDPDPSRDTEAGNISTR